MKGVNVLKLETLNKLFKKFPRPENLLFVNMFKDEQYPSDTIRWMVEYGSVGMTPFVAPGSPAPAIGDDFYASEGSAVAAYWKEKIFLDEVLLNNLREPLTDQTKRTAEKQLARQNQRLRSRCDRRKEWMISQMLFNNAFSFQIQGGTKFSVNYNVPGRNTVTLAGDDRWDTGAGVAGATATPIRDILDIRQDYVDEVGKEPEYAIITTDLLRLMMFDPQLQTLLMKSTFGDGDLFAKPAIVLANLLGIGNMIIYDEWFDISSWVTVVTNDTTFTVEDATDFEAGQPVRVYNMRTTFDFEEAEISAVNYMTNVITLAGGGVTSANYAAGDCRIQMRKRFASPNEFLFFSKSIDNEPIAEFMEAPFGNQGNYGAYLDFKEEWDPDGIWLRVQNKGLPVLYWPNTIFRLRVR
jgi:hypothetical protein